MISPDQIAEFERIARTHCGTVGRRAIDRLINELERAQALLDESRSKLRDRDLLDRVDDFFKRY